MLETLSSQYAALMLWFGNHPFIGSMIVWPLVSAFLTWVLGPHSKEELDAMSPRVAAFLRLVSGLGVDTPKTLAAVKKLIAGKP